MTNTLSIPAELTVAAAPVINETIERHRASCMEKGSEETPFRLDQMRSIVDGLEHVRPLSTIAHEAGLTESQVLDAVAKLGSWLSKAHGAAPVPVVTWDEVRQPPLMQVAPAPAGKGKKAAAPTASKKKSSKARKIPPTRIIAPQGFDPVSTGRDLRKSLGAVVACSPGQVELNRFLARTYNVKRKEVTFELVAAVWFFARLGRLDEIGQVNAKSREFTWCAVAAYDLLEVARHDAMVALTTLLNGSGDLVAYSGAVVKLRPLFQAETARLERLITLAQNSAQASTALDKELRFLARRVEANPQSFVLTTIADLNEGQVRRVAQAAGLDVDANIRVEENAVRRRLQEMGLDNDVDRLLSEGVRAVRAGVESLFWEACERYQDGDPSWDADLQVAMAASVEEHAVAS